MFGALFRKLPAFKGKLRIASIVTKLFLNPAKERVVNCRDGIILKLPNLIEYLSLELYANGYYEKELVDFLEDALPPHCNFIDVGANIGAISVFVAKKRPDVTIYSFEASAGVTNYLRENIFLNKLSNINIINKAVYTVDEIDMDFYSPEDEFGKGSLSPVFTNKKESVKTVRLDTFFKENSIVPAYIKIDVEGFEYFVIESLGVFLKEDGLKPVIIFEFVDWAEQSSSSACVGAAQTSLLANGYRIYDFFEFSRGLVQPINTIIKSGSRELIGIAE